MAAPRNRRHILVPGAPEVEAYRPHRQGMASVDLRPPGGRGAHGRRLQRAFEQAVALAAERRDTDAAAIQGAAPGLYLQFESRPGIALQLESLGSDRQGIELVAVTQKQTASKAERVELATVFIPEGKLKHFVSRFEAYSRSTPKKERERRYEGLIDPIADLRLATLHALWTDALDAYPRADQAIWWEVWLRRHDGKELQRLLEFAQSRRLSVGERRLEFDQRIVVLVRGTPHDLAASLDVMGDLAELRLAKETAATFTEMSGAEQADWLKDLQQRVRGPEAGAPAVCVLDTGVNRGHPLLSQALAAEDCHACDPAWRVDDRQGHGTEMAGLALFGDLAPILEGRDPVLLRHLLESVKVRPPKESSPPELYGALTAMAAGLVEVQAPTRRRCFSLAVTAPDQRDRGQPTSWSAAIDALAAGRSFDASTKGLIYLDPPEIRHRRLFVVCTGNVARADLAPDHLSRSAVEPVHDPGQAWNALTVGACTHKTLLKDPFWKGWTPVARSGELSPWSSTSESFADAWPIKPDVVFEGGNVASNGKNEIDIPDDLCLLSTHWRPQEKSFVASDGTSAATSQVARMAAEILAEYPQLWPEAVRALLVHSARWTPAMLAHVQGKGRKRDRAAMVRRYGFGVPNTGRALRSADDSLTLIAQASIHPFRKSTMREMHLFRLPWPERALRDLGAATVRLRVTLSYFVEPNPTRRGWRQRYRYASHGLRFEVKEPTDTVDVFRKRLNQRALEEDELKPAKEVKSNWFLGTQVRSHGSLHSDIWEGSAVDLADRGVVGVYPVSGWWKDQPKRDRSNEGARYALVVSIETDEVDVDLWTPVAVATQVPVETVIET